MDFLLDLVASDSEATALAAIVGAQVSPVRPAALRAACGSGQEDGQPRF